MMDLLNRHVSCPYCGEPIELLVDESERGQQYIEDCEVCCRPILISVSADSSGEALLTLSRDDE
jgi:hypothetical protein